MCPNPKRPTSFCKSVFILATLLLVGTVATLAGCNTTEGFGKDVKAAGKGIENAASDAK